jgi:hypothetical protein
MDKQGKPGVTSEVCKFCCASNRFFLSSSIQLPLQASRTASSSVTIPTLPPKPRITRLGLSARTSPHVSPRSGGEDEGNKSPRTNAHSEDKSPRAHVHSEDADPTGCTSPNSERRRVLPPLPPSPRSKPSSSSNSNVSNSSNNISSNSNNSNSNSNNNIAPTIQAPTPSPPGSVWREARAGNQNSNWRSSVTLSATAPLLMGKNSRSAARLAAADVEEEVDASPPDEAKAAEQLYTWGLKGITKGKRPQPVPINTLEFAESVKTVCCGAHHFVLLTSLKRCFTWGKGSHGQLGHGETLTVTEVRLTKCIHISYLHT